MPEVLDERLKNAFLVYLMGHNRPMTQDMFSLYRAEFEGMALESIDPEQLQGTLPDLVARIHKALSDDDRRFLIDFKQGKQDWKAFVLPEAEMLPSIQWKLLNLARMTPEKRRQAVSKLEKVLYGYFDS